MCEIDMDEIRSLQQQIRNVDGEIDEMVDVTEHDGPFSELEENQINNRLMHLEGKRQSLIARLKKQ